MIRDAKEKSYENSLGALHMFSLEKTMVRYDSCHQVPEELSYRR